MRKDIMNIVEILMVIGSKEGTRSRLAFVSDNG
jgi:hypothetical protein